MSSNPRLRDLFRQLQETEDRCRAICAEYSVFFKRMLRLRRGIYILQYNILEYRKKVMAALDAELCCGTRSRHRAVENNNDSTSSEKKSAVGIVQGEKLNCSTASGQPLYEQEPAETKAGAIHEDISSNKVKRELLEHDSSYKGTSGLPTKISSLKIIHERANKCNIQETFVYKKLPETKEIILQTSESSVKPRNPKSSNSATSSAKNSNKPKDSIALEKTAENDSRKNTGLLKFPITDRPIWYSAGNFQKFDKLSKECGDNPSNTKIIKLHEFHRYVAKKKSTSAGFQAPKLKDGRGNHSKSSTKADRNFKNFEHLADDAGYFASYSKSTGTHRGKGGSLPHAKSDTELDSSSFICTHLQRHNSMIILKSTTGIKEVKPFTSFNVRKYAVHHHHSMKRVNTSDYFHVVDDQEVLLPKGDFLIKKRSLFHLRWKTSCKIKMRTRSFWHHSKSKGDMNRKGKSDLFSRILGPFKNCGIGTDKTCTSDLPEDTPFEH